MATSAVPAVATAVESKAKTRAERSRENRERARLEREAKRAAKLAQQDERDRIDPHVLRSLEERRRALRGISGGAYYRIKRSTPHEFEGRPQLIFTLEESDTIDDLEVFLRDLAIRSGWGPGDYIIEACAKGQHGIVLWTESLPLGNMPAGTAATGATGGPIDQIKQVGEVVGAVRQLTGGGGESMTTALDATVRAFSAGMQAAPKPADPFSSPLVAMFVPVLTKFVEHIMAPKPEPPPQIDRTLELIERLGYARRDAAAPMTPMQTIADSMTNAKAIVDAATVLSGGPAGRVAAQPSSLVVWAQTIQAITPGIVQMVGQIVGVARDVIDARKTELAMRAGMARTVQPTATGGGPATTDVAPPSPMSGFERAIVEGIHTPEIFQGLANRLTELGHGGLIAAIKGGQVDAPMILEQGRTAIPQLALPGADVFVTRFVEWIHAGGNVAPAPAGPQKKIRCTKCGQEGQIGASVPLSTLQCMAPHKNPDGSESVCGGPVVQIVG
jgi:hypothetical protein